MFTHELVIEQGISKKKLDFQFLKAFEELVALVGRRHARTSRNSFLLFIFILVTLEDK